MTPIVRVGSLAACVFLLDAIRACWSAEEAAPSRVGEDTMKCTHPAVISCIEAIQRAQRADDFYEIDRCIRNLPSMPKRGGEYWRRQRRLRLDLWLRAIDKINRTIDQNFDVSDAPHRNVAPPVGADVSAGASPSAIKDPKLRKEYEEAVKANADKADRYRLQHLLRRLDKEWSRQMLIFVRSQYTLTGQDAAEVADRLDKVLSDTQRRKEIKKALGLKE